MTGRPGKPEARAYCDRNPVQRLPLGDLGVFSAAREPPDSACWANRCKYLGHTGLR